MKWLWNNLKEYFGEADIEKELAFLTSENKRLMQEIINLKAAVRAAYNILDKELK